MSARNDHSDQLANCSVQDLQRALLSAQLKKVTDSRDALARGIEQALKSADGCQYTTRREALQEEIERLEARLEELSAETQGKDDIISALTAGKQDADGKNALMAAEIRTMENTIASLKNQNAEKDDTIASLTGENQDKGEAIDALTADAQHKNDAIALLTEEKQKMDDLVASLSAEKDAITAELNAEQHKGQISAEVAQILSEMDEMQLRDHARSLPDDKYFALAETFQWSQEAAREARSTLAAESQPTGAGVSEATQEVKMALAQLEEMGMRAHAASMPYDEYVALTESFGWSLATSAGVRARLER